MKELVPQNHNNHPDTSKLVRRDFLSRSATLSLLSVSAAGLPVYSFAMGPTPRKASGKLWAGNVQRTDFEPVVGESVTLRARNGMAVSAKLIEVESHNPRRRLPRMPFSVIFDVPRPLLLEDGFYELLHPALGSMDLFMSPVDLRPRHRRLQAVFA